MFDALGALVEATRGEEWKELYRSATDRGKIFMIAEALGNKVHEGVDKSKRPYLHIPEWGKKIFFTEKTENISKVVEL